MISEHNANPPRWRTNAAHFLRSGETQRIPQYRYSGNDRTLLSDMQKQLVVPEEVAITNLRQDIVNSDVEQKDQERSPM